MVELRLSFNYVFKKEPSTFSSAYPTIHKRRVINDNPLIFYKSHQPSRSTTILRVLCLPQYQPWILCSTPPPLVHSSRSFTGLRHRNTKKKEKERSKVEDIMELSLFVSAEKKFHHPIYCTQQH